MRHVDRVIIKRTHTTSRTRKHYLTHYHTHTHKHAHKHALTHVDNIHMSERAHDFDYNKANLYVEQNTHSHIPRPIATPIATTGRIVYLFNHTPHHAPYGAAAFQPNSHLAAFANFCLP